MMAEQSWRKLRRETPQALRCCSMVDFGVPVWLGMQPSSVSDRSGSLGEDLRDTVAKCVLAAAQSASDFKVILPPAVQNSPVLQVARFQDAGVGVLTVVLGGQLQISSEQADLLASQLNQALSAQGTPTR